jgi:hypothetical protein
MYLVQVNGAPYALRAERGAAYAVARALADGPRAPVVTVVGFNRYGRPVGVYRVTPVGSRRAADGARTA